MTLLDKIAAAAVTIILTALLAVIAVDLARGAGHSCAPTEQGIVCP